VKDRFIVVKEISPVIWSRVAVDSNRTYLSIIFDQDIRMESSNTQLQQAQLIATWKAMRFQGNPPLTLDEVHFRVHSQNGEDGILLHLFSLIGTTDKKVLELCAGDGQTCNSANLIINHDWEGYLFDGNQQKVDAGTDFFKSCRDTGFWPPKFKQAWIARDNINDLVAALNLSGAIDLLSLDIDGNDYWIFEALESVQPRVVIAEYQQGWGPDIAVTQRYQEDFDWASYKLENPGPTYTGSSLKALVNLASQKGLRLVGCERKCFNAVFIRNGIAEDIFPEIDPAACFGHRMARYNMAWLPERIDTADPFWEYL